MRRIETRHQGAELICAYGTDGGTMRLRVTAIEGGVFRVTRTRAEAFSDAASDAVCGARPFACDVKREGDLLRMAGDGAAAEIDLRTGSVRFLAADGTALLAEDARRPCEMEARPVYRSVYDDGAKIVQRSGVDGVHADAEASETRLERTAWACRHNLRFDADEALYGLGSHEEGYGNLRGRCRMLYQHNLKAVVPVLVSTKGWGLLYDLGCAMAFHDDDEESYVWAECADEFDYYFMSGGYARVMAAYARLTGPTPLLPRYAYGYTQSKERYVDAQEMLEVAREYRRRGVPLDVLVLDWCSWPEGQWGYKTLDRSRFPDPKAFTDALHAMHVRLMVSIWPSMQGDANGDRREMLEAGCMLGNRTVYDAFDERARRLYWRQAEAGLFRHGVDAWWCDCTEPFEADWHGGMKPEPHERARINTQEAARYIDPARINLFSLHHSRGIYEGQRRSGSGKRVYNLTRSSFAGQHRYATVTWSGDVSASWAPRRRPIPEGLHLMAAGAAYWSADIGGFFVKQGREWFRAGDFERGVDDPGYRELYVRWLQYAAFLPIMRSHGTDTPREIWRFGEPGEPFYDAILAAIRMRYALLPYIYSLAAACTATGMPMLRFPALAFPEDMRARRVEDEMMLGGFLLVKPVTRPMYFAPGGDALHEDRTEVVYLPECAGWYAMDTGEFFAGGGDVRIDEPLSRIPVFVRAGAILPTAPVTQHTDDRPGELTLMVWPGADGAFTLYDDAGDGYGYERGECARSGLARDDAADELRIGECAGCYPGMAREIGLTVRRMGGGEVRVRYTGEALRVGL